MKKYLITIVLALITLTGCGNKTETKTISTVDNVTETTTSEIVTEITVTETIAPLITPQKTHSGTPIVFIDGVVDNITNDYQRLTTFAYPEEDVDDVLFEIESHLKISNPDVSSDGIGTYYKYSNGICLLYKDVDKFFYIQKTN